MKTTTICGTTIDEKDYKLPEEIFCNSRHKEGTTRRWVGGTDLWYNQIPHPPGGHPTNWRVIILQRFSHRSESSEPHIRIPSPGVQHREDKPPRTFGFEDQWGLIAGASLDWGRDFIQRASQHPSAPDPRKKEQSARSLTREARPICWSWRVSQWAREEAVAYPRDLHNGGRHFGEHSNTWMVLFVAAILAYQHQDLAPPNRL